MSAVHLDAYGVALCDNGSHNLGDLSATTCKRCLHRLERVVPIEADAAAERRYLAEQAQACRAVGLGDAWDTVAAGDTPHTRMVRNMLGTVALYALEVAAEKKSSVKAVAA